MEGPELRSSPRTLLGSPIELRVGEKTIRLDRPLGNVSARGLFLRAEKLPVNTPVHVKFAAVSSVEEEGVVRSSDATGVWIEFIARNEAERQRLDGLIAELIQKETFAN